MSSTNRKSRRKKYDYYVTPIDDIQLFLKHFKKETGIKLGDIDILDPCAWWDENHPMSYPVALNVDNVITIDIREDSRADVIDNYFEYSVWKFNLVISNPPFNQAIEFIKKWLEDCKEWGYVVMLLRLNFFGSKKRFKFFQGNMPKYCFIHHKRMSFTPDGKTDSIEYAHFVWKKWENPEFTKTKVI